MGNVKIKGTLGCSGHGIVELRSMKGGKRQAHTFGLQQSTPWLLQVSLLYIRKVSFRKWRQKVVTLQQHKDFVLLYLLRFVSEG